MIEPHGGKLIWSVDKSEETLARAKSLPSITIAPRHAIDAEMIATGVFSPLTGFLTKDEVDEVVNSFHLPTGEVWSIPIVLPISVDQWNDIEEGKEYALTVMGEPIAIIKVKDKFQYDLKHLVKEVFLTDDENHPGVQTFYRYGKFFIGGDITLVQSFVTAPFRPNKPNISEAYYMTPQETRKFFEAKGWKTIVAFQTRNPIHRAHEYLIKCALEMADGTLIHPLVGETKKDDIPADTRMKCYEVLIDNYFNRERVLLSVLPANMFYAGPREAIHHMIMRKNYGCSHMIIGRDHAGVGSYYGTYDAQKLADQFADELGIQPLKFEHAFYCKKCKGMATAKTCPHPAEDHVFLSGTKVRQMLREGKDLPEEFTRPEVAQVLKEWVQTAIAN